jgi:hypothetical protein
LTDCKPVKTFENRGKAVARTWTTIRRLGNAIEPQPVEDTKPREEARPAAETKQTGKPRATRGAKPAPKAKAAAGKARGHPQGAGHRDAAVQGRGHEGRDYEGHGAGKGTRSAGSSRSWAARAASRSPARVARATGHAFTRREETELPLEAAWAERAGRLFSFPGSTSTGVPVSLLPSGAYTTGCCA